MVKKGDNLKDMKAYLNFRVKHLELERKQINNRVKPEVRDRAYKKLTTKIEELKKVIFVLNGDIKRESKKEYAKTQSLMMNVPHPASKKEVIYV